MSDNSIKDQEYNGISPSGYNYGKDPKAWHPFWSQGTETPTTEYIKSITEENGILTITKSDDTSFQVDINDEGIVELKDTVVENEDGSDTHKLVETQNDGTENDVGSFTISNKQLLKVAINDNILTFTFKDQYGTTSEQNIELPKA